tara:strand:+ start:9185 stop:9484 length:300 start_codon:yes stop_codon:yes gene_type:complete
MKMYNNGQRKAMMYGGMSKRKPMMYGGTAKKKPRKKAYGGGMMSATPTQQNMSMKQQQPRMMMASGDKATKFGMLSVKAGIDKNPKPTAADRIAGARGK